MVMDLLQVTSIPLTLLALGQEMTSVTPGYSLAQNTLSKEIELLRPTKRQFQIFEGYKSAKNVDEALFYANRLLKLQPRNPIYYVMLGDCYTSLGKLDEAIECYDRALDMDESIPFLTDDLINHAKKAIDILEKVRSSSGQNEVSAKEVLKIVETLNESRNKMVNEKEDSSIRIKDPTPDDLPRLEPQSVIRNYNAPLENVFNNACLAIDSSGCTIVRKAPPKDGCLACSVDFITYRGEYMSIMFLRQAGLGSSHDSNIYIEHRSPNGEFQMIISGEPLMIANRIVSLMDKQLGTGTPLELHEPDALTHRLYNNQFKIKRHWWQ